VADPQFHALVDRALASLLNDGEFQRLDGFWFMRPIPPRKVGLDIPMTPPFAEPVPHATTAVPSRRGVEPPARA
jgi:glutamate/aspartate transport system substrate-binding protein